jgi:hypothetical protein
VIRNKLLCLLGSVERPDKLQSRILTEKFPDLANLFGNLAFTEHDVVAMSGLSGTTKAKLNAPVRRAPAFGGGAIPDLLRMGHLMSTPPSAVAQSKGAGRRFLRWRHVLFGIVCLSVVFALALYIWIRSLPPFWWLDHDKVMYTRISKAIAADPRPLWDKRLYDFIR